MRRNGILRRVALLFSIALILCVTIVGCETLHNAGFPGLDDYVKPDPVAVAEEKSNREKFSIQRDHQALNWLLTHRIHNGMQLHEVEEALGGPGEYTTDYNGADSQGLHQVTESAYKWGPDSKGQSVVIWFRDGHVCNFNPGDYKKP